MKYYRLTLAATLVICSCTTPSQKFYRSVEQSGLEQHVMEGQRFDHLILSRNTGNPTGSELHVYIEGDGSAWIANKWVAADPTPRQPVALELMSLDPGPVLYLGRPCYFDLQRNCSSSDWTDGRYSETVVRSMTQALTDTLERLGWTEEVALIGYSGGGVLAMLLAPRVTHVGAVVTVAANLDIDAWAKLHDYTPLSTSLNPAEEPLLPSRIRQYHLIGELDRNVPPAIARPVIERQSTAKSLHYAGFNHSCCWQEIWPALLNELN